MSIADAICLAIIILIVGGVGLYLYKAKKAGNHCIGCPNGKQCGKKSCDCGGISKK